MPERQATVASPATVETSTLRIPSNLATLAKAVDDQVVSAFRARVADLSKTYTERETSVICNVSINMIHKLKVDMDLTFADRSVRTKDEQAWITRMFKIHRAETQARVIQKKSPVSPGSIKVTPKVEAAGRVNLWTREKIFLAKVVEYAKTMTFAETCQLTGMSQRGMRNFAYENEISFSGYNGTSTAGLDLFDLDMAVQPELSSEFPSLPWVEGGEASRKKQKAEASYAA